MPEKPKQNLTPALTEAHSDILWYQIPIEEIAKNLQVDPKAGLSKEEVEQRRKLYGSNVLPEEEVDTFFDILARQFKSPLVYILLVAAFLTLALREFSDFTIISVAVVVNVVVGFAQERRASNTLSELKKVIKFHTKVLRGKEIHEIESSGLVPGDIVLIAAGDRVPADIRLISADNLEVVEAALTGESVPSIKAINLISQDTPLADRENMVFMGTEVAFGKGRGIVVKTGSKTEIGSIATMIAETEKRATPLQTSLAQFSRFLAWVTLGLSFLLLVIGLYHKINFYEILVTAVAVAVAAIPEGLLISMTVILAIGMQRVLKRRGLVRHLASAETLGSTSIICTDKTGTLTMGEMQVVSVVTPSSDYRIKKGIPIGEKNSDILDVLKISAMCNESIVEDDSKPIADWKIIGSPTDKALLIAAAEVGFTPEKTAKYREVFSIPFDEKRKYAASIREGVDYQTFYVKGAAEIILENSTELFLQGKKQKITDKEKQMMLTRFEEMTQRGLRVLGVGYRHSEDTDQTPAGKLGKLIFMGFVGLKDPLRQEVPDTIQQAKRAGLRPVIITGDHKFTAAAIAREAGLEVEEENILEGKQLDGMDEQDLSAIVEKIKLYSRVTPAHKLRIIDAWQKKGEVVAMTGDGVNDAPALKKADIGMSLGSGTEVARQASDLVLLDNNFRTIVAAIEEGRIIFNNIRKVIVYLLADSFSQLVLIIGALFLNLPIPLLPAMILWTNLITDGLPNLALTVEPSEIGIMDRKPRKKSEPLINTEMRTLILWVGLATDVLFLVIYTFISKSVELSYARTMVFAAFGISSLIYVFSLKDLRAPLWKIPLFNNWKLILAVAMGLVLQFLAIYWSPFQELLRTESLPLNLWWIVIGLSLIKVVAIELTKTYYRAKEGF